MATYSSSSATGTGSMRAALMLMLLLGAVVAAHGRQVLFENKCNLPVTVSGVVIIPAKGTVDINVVGQLTIELADKAGVLRVVKFYCPKDVTALEVVCECPSVLVCESGCVKVKGLPGPVSPLVGLVLGVLCCNCC